MPHHRLSFAIALGVILCAFFAFQSLKGHEGQAQASSTGLAAKTIAEGARFSAADKRAIRRALLDHPDGLMDLTAPQVRAVLDQPELVRRDLPTVVWQYRTDSCVLDIYFTTSKANAGRAPVAYYEVRARETGGDDEAVQGGCLSGMVRARSGGMNFVNLGALYKAR